MKKNIESDPKSTDVSKELNDDDITIQYSKQELEEFDGMLAEFRRQVIEIERLEIARESTDKIDKIWGELLKEKEAQLRTCYQNMADQSKLDIDWYGIQNNKDLKKSWIETNQLICNEFKEETNAEIKELVAYCQKQGKIIK
ncbi:MAG: hypothetical protein WC570_01925 [Patescibacteria group bacterium]